MLSALTIVSGLYLGSLALRAGLALATARRLPPVPKAGPPPGSLTLAQPILSGDPWLESRLRENLEHLPDQAFHWLVDEDDAEGRRVAEAMRAEHPEIDIRVEACPPCPARTNPKTWKLVRAAEQLRTPFLVVLDDDTTLPPGSAAALIAAADTHTVATGLPCYEDTGDIASGLLAQFVNNNSIFTYLGTTRLLDTFTLNGMGYTLHRRELAGIGNFEPILGELTDDLALATRVLEHGGRIHQSLAPLRVRTGVRGLAAYARLMHRWHVFSLILLRQQGAVVGGLVLFLHGLPPLLLGALLLLAAGRTDLAALGVVLLVLALRAAILIVLQRRFFRAVLHRPLLSLLSELLQPLHLLHALLCRTIRWRTRRYRVRDSRNFQET